MSRQFLLAGILSRTALGLLTFSTAIACGFAEESLQNESTALYAPKADDFREAYKSDTANQAKQSWEDYHGWVLTFYRGNFLDEGWTAHAKRLTSRIKNVELRSMTVDSMNRLGKKIAAEWAKDNDVRRISSKDVAAWGRLIDDAAKLDDGTGEKVRSALTKIDALAMQKTKSP